MEEREPGRETLFGVSGPEWPATFWLFVAQMTVEGARVVIGSRERLSSNPLEWMAHLRSELSDDVLVSAAIAIMVVEIWRVAMVTAAWLQRQIDKRENRLRDEAEARGEARGEATGEARILALLNEETRKEVEGKLRRRDSGSD